MPRYLKLQKMNLQPDINWIFYTHWIINVFYSYKLCRGVTSQVRQRSGLCRKRMFPPSGAFGECSAMTMTMTAGVFGDYAVEALVWGGSLDIDVDVDVDADVDVDVDLQVPRAVWFTWCAVC